MDKLTTPREPSEAERLAQALTDWKSREVRDLDRLDAAAELRRLQAENDALRAMHDARARVQASGKPSLETLLKRLGGWTTAEVSGLIGTHPAAPTAEAQPDVRLEDDDALRFACRVLDSGSLVCQRKTRPLHTHPAAPQPAALPELSDAEIEAIGHRMASKYRHSSNPEISHTYVFELHTLCDFARAVIAAMKGKQ